MMILKVLNQLQKHHRGGSCRAKHHDEKVDAAQLLQD
jgi:hypothetical protein